MNSDTVKLSYVMLQKHINLGGDISKYLQAHGQLMQLHLLPSGMVQVVKPSGTFYVAASVVESVEAADAAEAAKQMTEETFTEKVAERMGRKAARKAADTQPPVASRANELLDELQK